MPRPRDSGSILGRSGGVVTTGILPEAERNRSRRASRPRAQPDPLTGLRFGTLITGDPISTTLVLGLTRVALVSCRVRATSFDPMDPIVWSCSITGDATYVDEANLPLSVTGSNDRIGTFVFQLQNYDGIGTVSIEAEIDAGLDRDARMSVAW